MPSIEQLMDSVERDTEVMVEALREMLRIPAIGPENGGDGEFERARFIKSMLDECGFDIIEMYDALDERVRLRFRPNLVARKNGTGDRTVWIVTHMDTVPPGDLDSWESPPFAPRMVDGRLYGLGSEDNGQALIASLFAARHVIQENGMPGSSIGLAMVADEEAGNTKGIQFLLDEGVFKKGDVIIVPDFGTPDGSTIEVAEKSTLWVKITVEGKQVHASTPDKGINAMRVGSEFLTFLLPHLERVYGDTNHMFRPVRSTFAPTKRLQTVGNINTIPGEDILYLDCRLLPGHNPDDVLKTMRDVACVFETQTSAYITVEVEMLSRTAPESDPESEGFVALAEAIERVRGIKAKPVGIGGGTCANEFRKRGFDAYVWETVDGNFHAPNENCKVENMVSDAKVFSHLLARLCYDGYQ